MCGIVGSVAKATYGYCHSDSRVFDELLYIDALRGDDSTGVAVMYNDGDMQVIKDTGEAAFFRYHKDYHDLLTALVKKGKAVIGHNRKKTTGGADAESAHPFVIPDAWGLPRFAFVHNGTLTNHYTLSKDLEKNLEEIDVYGHTKPSTDVDSETLGTMICLAEGDKTKLETVLSKVSGAYACVWMDNEQEKVYMVRNSERPLFLAATSMGWCWASEPGFLYATCNRNRLKVETCEQIDIDTLYTFDLAKNSLVKEKLTLKKATPATRPATHIKRGKAVGANTFRSLSKNGFKKLKARLMGTSMCFFVDDYVERHIGDLGNAGWHVWGCNADDQICRAVLAGMTENDLVFDYAGAWLEGTVFEVAYDESVQNAVFYLRNLKKVTNETCQ
jgi:predicted glutamine amidotransferase